MSVQVEKDFTLCGLSIRPAVTALTILQILLALTLGISYRILLHDLGMIISIVMCIHVFCAVLALVFLLFVTLGRKLGSFYEVILHAHLIGINYALILSSLVIFKYGRFLLVGLASLFCTMYIPLSFLQQRHSLGESLHFLGLSLGAAAMFLLQFVQKNANEQMLGHIEHTFSE